MPTDRLDRTVYRYRRAIVVLTTTVALEALSVLALLKWR